MTVSIDARRSAAAADSDDDDAHQRYATYSLRFNENVT